MTPTLHIHVLGELEIRRAGRTVALPPSRKTRALLAYLALTGRTFRREQLCDMFWDVADDPRAELRWSLSKLRGVLDEDRLEAGRDEVGLRLAGVEIDAVALRRAARALAATSTEELERLVGTIRGELLEGLDLPEFDAYQAWCVAQREEARGARGRVLEELVRRHAGDPARALEPARARVVVDPHDVEARATLIGILGALGRRDEARAYHEAGRKHADAAGLAVLEAAAAALERVPSRAPSASPPPPPAPGRASAPLVGRSAELAALDAALAQATQRHQLVAVALTGSLGAGKSRLLDAWLPRAAAAGATTVGATAFEADAGRPYGPWLDALARLPGATSRPPELARLARARSTEPGATADRDQLLDEAAGAIAAHAATRTLVVALDDAHWLDADSSALLHPITRHCERLPVVVVLAARPGELDDNLELARALRGLRQRGVLVECELAPLDEATHASLVHAIRPDADAGAVFARSGGNPLFALELARAGDTTAPPRSVATAIRDRLATLPEDAAQLLRWGAVLRRGFTAEELAAVSGLGAEAAVGALEMLERHALLVRDLEAYAFGHELVRQVVYDALSEPRRRLMHRRIAETLAARVARGDDRVDVADVAHHAAAAHDAELATRTCLAAARRSMRVFATADAHALARRGLRHAEGLPEPERTRCTLELYEVALAARRPEDREPTARHVEELAARALDLGLLEQARLGYHLLAYLRWERGAWTDAQRHMRHAHLISRGAPEREQIVGMAEAARCLVILEKDLPEAQALALEAAARGRAAGVEPPATFSALGMLHLHRGELERARSELERALAIARVRRDHHDEYQALEQLVLLELARGDAAAARARTPGLVALGARFEEGSEAPFARGLHALACGEDAEVELDAALDALATVDAKQRLAYLASRAAWRDAEHDAPRAEARARRALAAALPLERATEIALARGVLARLVPAEAAAHLEDLAARWPHVAEPVRALLRPLVDREGER